MKTLVESAEKYLEEDNVNKKMYKYRIIIQNPSLAGTRGEWTLLGTFFGLEYEKIKNNLESRGEIYRVDASPMIAL